MSTVGVPTLVAYGANVGTVRYDVHWVKPPSNTEVHHPRRRVLVFAECLLKVNLSEKVRYNRDDQLGEAVISVIANFL